MKTKEELQELSFAIGKAERAYHKAIADNLKEGGKEYNVLNPWGDVDEDDEEVNGINLTISGYDDDLYDELIDKVRWNEEKGIIEYHCSKFNYKKVDNWNDVSYLGDDVDYVFDAIDWEN